MKSNALHSNLGAMPTRAAVLTAAAGLLLLPGCPPPVMNGETGPDVVVTDGPPPDAPPADAPPSDTPPGDTMMMGSPGCMMYCTQLATNCTAANAQYADMNDCLTYCAAANWPVGTPGEMSGNTLACRIYHGGAPAQMSAATHCPHAGPTGDGVCGSITFRTDMPTAYRRVDRMGMPAVSTALVGSARKNAFNDGDPAMDMSFAGDFITALSGLHTALDDDLIGLNLTPCSMTTMVSGLPQCLGQTFMAGRTVASLIVPNDVLQINPAMPSGFPNGRRLADPVIDVTLAVLLLSLNGGNCGMAGTNCTPLTLANLPLNPRANDLPLLTTFPYLAAPHAP